MNEATPSTEPAERPSGPRAFFGGFGSGMLSGALMMGVVFTLGAIATLYPPLAAIAPHVLSWSFVGTAAFMSVATGLFGGLMNMKRTYASTAAAAHTDVIPVTIPMQSQDLALAPATVLPDAVEQEAPTKNWAAETGRNANSQTRIQQILANGSLSDTDRAHAILAAREAAPTSTGLGA